MEYRGAGQGSPRSRTAQYRRLAAGDLRARAAPGARPEDAVPADLAGELLAAIAELEAHAELRAVRDGLAGPELDGLAESLRRYALLAARARRVAGSPAHVPELNKPTQAAAFRVRRRRCTTRCGTRAQADLGDAARGRGAG